MKPALIVVDAQESFRRRPYFRERDVPAFLHNVQSLTDRCEARGIPVVQIFHQEPGEDPDNPFCAASGCAGKVSASCSSPASAPSNAARPRRDMRPTSASAFVT